MTRTAQITRTTGETDVSLTLGLDGSGAGSRTTGVGFLDHMLDLLARHGRLDLDVDVRGDLETGAPARASTPAAAPMRTSLMRRRKWRTESPEAKRAAPAVGSVWFEPAT